MYVNTVEPCRIEGCSHFDLTIDPLFAQHGDGRFSLAYYVRHMAWIEGQFGIEASIVLFRRPDACKFLVGAGGGIPSSLHEVAGLGP